MNNIPRFNGEYTYVFRLAAMPNQIMSAQKGDVKRAALVCDAIETIRRILEETIPPADPNFPVDIFGVSPMQVYKGDVCAIDWNLHANEDEVIATFKFYAADGDDDNIAVNGIDVFKRVYEDNPPYYHQEKSWEEFWEDFNALAYEKTLEGRFV